MVYKVLGVKHKSTRYSLPSIGVMTKQMNGEQTIIRGYYALPAMIERRDSGRFLDFNKYDVDNFSYLFNG